MSYRKALFRTIISLAAIILILNSCGKAEVQAPATDEVPKMDPVSSTVESSGADEALIVFLTGEASVTGAAGYRDPEIGEMIVAGEQVHTGDDGTVELQIGSLGVVRIGSNTVYTLDEVQISDGTERASGTVSSGSIIARVRRLVGGDAFHVKIPGAVCSVRGTKFLVRADDLGSTTIAVTEGSVFVAPPSMADSGMDSEQGELLTQIRSLMPLVSSSEEITLEETTFAAAEEKLAAWIAETPDDRTNQVETLQADLVITIDQAPEPVPINEDNAAELDTEAPELLLSSATETDETAPALVPLTIRVEPAGATIYLNGKAAGTGSVSRIYPAGTPVEIRAETPDGRTQDRRVEVGTESVVELTFESLEEENKSSTTEGNEAETVEAAVSTEAAVSAQPQDTVLEITPSPPHSTVYVDGRNQGRGKVRYPVAEGSEVTIRIEAPGFEPQQRQVAAKQNTPPIRFDLDPLLIVNRMDLPGRAVGTPAGSGGYVVAATITGNLIALDRNGEPKWIAETDNRDGENTTPIIIGNRVYVIGSAEMVILRLSDGRILRRRPLSGGLEDRFGRRLVSSPGGLLLPGDAGLSFIDPATGEDRAVMGIPQGSRSTPSVWRNHVIMADQRGSLLFINPESREIEQSVETGSRQPVGLAPAVSEDGTALIAGRRGTVSAVSISQASLLWDRDLVEGESIGVFTDVLVNRNTAFVWGEGRLFALNLDNGRDRFPPVFDVSAPPMLYGNYLFLCRPDGNMTILDSGTGRPVGEIFLDEVIRARPVANGNYVIAAGERQIVVVDPRSIIEN